jgi:uncharacterized protein
MRSVFFDAHQHWRSGWKALGFLLLTVVLSAPLLIGHRFLPPEVRFYVPGSWLAFLGVLLATAVCVRREKRSLGSVGLRLNRCFARHLASGISAGIALVGVSAGLVWLAGGFHFERVPDAQVGLLLRSAVIMLGVGLVEETAFHGYAFQRLVQGIGPVWTQLLMATLFTLGHPVGDLPAGPMALAMVNLFMAALIFGLCYLRTGSLALPVGLHMGWNWSMGALGIAVSGVEAKGWWAPVPHAGKEWLTGGSYGLEASPVDSAVLAVVLVALLRWKGLPLPLGEGGGEGVGRSRESAAAPSPTPAPRGT